MKNIAITHSTYIYFDYIDPDALLQKPKDTDKRLENLKEIGFEYDSKNALHFNANTFGRYMSGCIKCVHDQNGDLYIYNRKGFYEAADDWKLSKLIKFMLNQTQDLWSLYYEKSGLAAYKRDLVKIVKEFNKDNVINLANTIMDLSNMQTRSHSPEIYSTIQLPMNFDPDADCPRFLQFMEETTKGDAELQFVLQEILGYCLTCENRAEKAFFFYGGGSNGKSVLGEVIKGLVGFENTSGVSLNELGQRFGISPMIGKSVNISAENELSGEVNSENLKAIISGDELSIDIKHKDPWQGALTCKLILLMNTLPKTSDITYGFFRKIMIIPFENTVLPDQIDNHLLDKLLKELPGVLNWALQGLQRLRENQYRFSHSSAVEKIMQTYSVDQNPTGQFFLDTYEYCEGAQIRKSEIYRDYVNWCADDARDCPKLQKLWNMLKIKAEEMNRLPDASMHIQLEYKKIHGIDYLKNYRKKEIVEDNHSSEVIIP